MGKGEKGDERERVSSRELVGSGGMFTRKIFVKFESLFSWNALEILKMSRFCERFVFWNRSVR